MNCRMQNAECRMTRAPRGAMRPARIHPSSFITDRSPRGISLMEVLISLFILSVGLLGVAALIPVGRFAVVEATQSDRCAACGHAATARIKAQNLVNGDWWGFNPDGPVTAGAAFAVDPLGSSNFGGSIARVNYTNMAPALAQQTFIFGDDLLFDIPEDESSRPRGLGIDGTVGPPVSEGRYTWFLTVMPSAAEDAAAANNGWQARKNFTVSAAVCFQRDLTGGEDVPLSPGGGDMTAKFLQFSANAASGVERDDWLLVCGQRQGGIPVAQWYRVASAGTAGGTTFVTLHGPDWPSTYSVGQVIYMPSVIGVYTTTVALE